VTTLLRVRIDDAAFRDLVAGRTAKLQTHYGAEVAVEAILEDIGFPRMIEHVCAASKKPRPKPASGE
jgi:hypothetical protein